jgi:tRNA A-37 threonylcarbamoyl transferase component Bud32
MPQAAEDTGFPWPAKEQQSKWPTHAPGELPGSGPLAEFAESAIFLAHPSAGELKRPWVLARGERVVKVYDTAAVEQSDRMRAEADIAARLSDVPGVVRTVKVGEVGGWLVIEMERASEGLDQHLADVRSGKSEPLEPARYGELLYGVARTLQSLNDKGLVHRDIKPSNLLFTDAHDRLLVADFSIADESRKRGRRRATRFSGQPAGTDRYIAPEQFDGRVTATADQYALGVTALETIGDESVNQAAHAAIARATSLRAEDRFESVAEFGAALRAALAGRAERRLSNRLERVKPAWRHAWAPGFVAAAIAYVALLVVPVADIAPQRALVAPIVGGFVCVAVRVLARLHGKRTRPRLAIANQLWPAPMLALAAIALVATSHPKDASAFEKSALPLVAMAYAAIAWLGSTPPEAGGWLIAIVRRWERWQRARRRSASAYLTIFAMAAIVFWLPTYVHRSRGRPALPAYQPASHVGYVQTVSRFRAALLANALPAACRLVAATRPGDLPCSRWASLARRDLEQDLARSHREGFLGVMPVSALTVDDDSVSGSPGVAIETESGTAIAFGTFTASSVLQINVLRSPASTRGQSGEWTYEVSNRAGNWILTGVSACVSASSANCTYFMALSR